MKQESIFLLFFFVIQTVNIYSQGTWTQKMDFPCGNDSYFGFGFTIDDKAYVSGNHTDCFYEYNYLTDEWTQKADIPFNVNKIGAFSANNKGYIVKDSDNEVWQYDPVLDVWTQRNNFPAESRDNAIGFSHNGQGYYGLGLSTIIHSDMWKYDPINDSWLQLSDIPVARESAVAFIISDKAYIGTGHVFEGTSYYSNDFWEYDFNSDSWSQIADLPGIVRGRAVSFSINDFGYVGTGLSSGSTYLNDFYRYNPVLDTWTQLEDFAGENRQGAVSFVINNKGYITSGYDGSGMVIVYPDLWEYEPDLINYDNLQESEAFTIYPNPSNNTINITVQSSTFRIEILNLSGQVVLRKVNSNVIDLGNLSAGTYFVKIVDGNKNTLQKLLVVR